MKALRERLSYGNVVATTALFIALGGVAWAVEGSGSRSGDEDAARGAKAAAGILGGEVDALPAGDDFKRFSPIGGLASGADNDSFLAPTAFVATRLRVALRGNLGTGSRRFTLQLDGVNTPLKCTIRAPDRLCASNKRVQVFEGTGVTFTQQSNNADSIHDALFGWVAETP